MGEHFVVYVKKDALKAYLEKHGADSAFLSALYGASSINTRWHVLAEAFKDDELNDRSEIEGALLWAYILAGRYSKRWTCLVTYIYDVLETFGYDNVVLVSSYADFEGDYISLDDIAYKIGSFVKDSIKDYDALLSD